jgi:predicted glycosyltransferase
MKRQVHFVGFRTDRQYWNAVSVWGKPNFIHYVHDFRAYGEIDEDNDIVVLADKGRDVPTKWSYQDHKNF